MIMAVNLLTTSNMPKLEMEKVEALDVGPGRTLPLAGGAALPLVRNFHCKPGAQRFAVASRQTHRQQAAFKPRLPHPYLPRHAARSGPRMQRGVQVGKIGATLTRLL